MNLDSELNEEIRLKRWRLALGSDAADPIQVSLSSSEIAIDRALSTLYEGRLGKSSERKGNLAASSPSIATWLGDIRRYFPSSVVQVMQRDAIDRFQLRQLLLEPELLSAATPDIRLVATLLALKNLIPSQTKATARMVVQKVVDEIMSRLRGQLTQAVSGALNRSSRNRRPRPNEIDWDRTIRANFRHYLPEHKSIIPVQKIGFGRNSASLRDIILCIDQSGSMAESIVFAAVFGAALASLPAVSTKLIAFDTSIVDLSEDLRDPVDLLFGVQLGGGTDINQALSYCQTLILRPQETILFLISDLYESPSGVNDMIRRAAAIKASGATMIALLALNDSGAPSFEHAVASQFAALDIPAFACTPDQFPALIATAIAKRDLFEWTAKNDILNTRSSET